MERLIKALEAVAAYANTEEQGVQLTGVRCMDFGTFYLVEGVRKAYSRTYVVDYREAQPYVVERLGLCEDDVMIARAIEQQNKESADEI